MTLPDLTHGEVRNQKAALFSLRALRRLLPGVHARADRCRQGHQRGALRIRLEAIMLRGLHGLPALRRDRGLRLTPLTPSKI